MLEDVLLFRKRLIRESGQDLPADTTMSVTFGGQDGMDAIRSWLEECWILAKPLAWLTVAVDGFQGFRVDVRELVGRNTNDRTVLLMEPLEIGHKGS